MTDSSGPRRPPGRYDEPRVLPRPVLIALSAMLIIGLTAVAWWAYQRTRDGRVDVAVTGYQVLGDRAVTVSFEVHKPRDRVAACEVEALDRDGARVGVATVRVPQPQEQVRVTQRFATDHRATTAIVTGCRLEPAPTPAGP